MLPYINEIFQSEMLMIFYCQQGCLQMKLSEETIDLRAGDVYICKPLTPIHQVLTSSDCQVAVLLYALQVAEYVLPANCNLSRLLECDARLKVSFGEEFMDEWLSVLIDTVQQRAKDTRSVFRNNTLYHMFNVLLFDVLSLACRKNPGEGNMVNDAPSACRADTIFHMFIKLLKEDGGCHRTVAYYAEKLFITPKHLSKVIKKKTSNRALDVINNHALHLIKLDLKMTDIPISQLANKYNFNSFSFFCQFVRSHLDMTPQKYREFGKL